MTEHDPEVCGKCGGAMKRVSPLNESPLIMRCEDCGHEFWAEGQIPPPWPPADDEDEEEEEAEDPPDEPGWRSPLYEEAVICRRCIELAARSLEKDRDSGWEKPDNSEKSDVTA